MRANRYLEDAVRTAPPQALLCMLMDRLVLDVRTAIEGLITGDKGEARNRMFHAQAILLELRRTLDLEAWPEGRSLSALYTWFYAECSACWINDDAVRARRLLDQIVPLRDTWREAAALVAADRPQLTTQVV